MSRQHDNINMRLLSSSEPNKTKSLKQYFKHYLGTNKTSVSVNVELKRKTTTICNFFGVFLGSILTFHSFQYVTLYRG